MENETALIRADKKARQIAWMNKKCRNPTTDELRALKEHGADSWGEHVMNYAEENGMKLSTAWALFEALGENEAFDGFVTELQDCAEFDCE